jgi:hypothetical protein
MSADKGKDQRESALICVPLLARGSPLKSLVFPFPNQPRRLPAGQGSPGQSGQSLRHHQLFAPAQTWKRSSPIPLSRSHHPALQPVLVLLYLLGNDSTARGPAENFCDRYWRSQSVPISGAVQRILGLDSRIEHQYNECEIRNSAYCCIAPGVYQGGLHHPPTVKVGAGVFLMVSPESQSTIPI